MIIEKLPPKYAFTASNNIVQTLDLCGFLVKFSYSLIKCVSSQAGKQHFNCMPAATECLTTA